MRSILDSTLVGAAAAKHRTEGLIPDRPVQLLLSVSPAAKIIKTINICRDHPTANRGAQTTAMHIE
jgi:hypothetical protein